jgi:hypothetical protein
MFSSFPARMGISVIEEETLSMSGPFDQIVSIEATCRFPILSITKPLP